MKWRMPSVAEGFRGGARIVGGRGPTLQGHGSRPCVSRNVTGLRGTRGSPVGVSCSRRAPHITACNRFRIPVNGRHNLRNVFSCGSVCDGATHPKRMEGINCRVPKPARFKCSVERAAMAFAEKGLASRLGVRSPEAGISRKR